MRKLLLATTAALALGLGHAAWAADPQDPPTIPTVPAENGVAAYVDDAGTDNLNYIDQTLNTFGLGTTATITQVGTADGQLGGGEDANATILQAGAGQTVATIDQDGTGNVAWIDQNDDDGGTTGSFAEINQSGDGGLALILQDGFDHDASVFQSVNDAVASVDQSGDTNVAYVGQTVNDDAFADVVQSGSGGNTTVLQ